MAANPALSATRRLANRVSLCSELSVARRSVLMSAMNEIEARANRYEQSPSNGFINGMDFMASLNNITVVREFSGICFSKRDWMSLS